MQVREAISIDIRRSAVITYSRKRIQIIGNFPSVKKPVAIRIGIVQRCSKCDLLRIWQSIHIGICCFGAATIGIHFRSIRYSVAVSIGKKRIGTVSSHERQRKTIINHVVVPRAIGHALLLVEALETDGGVAPIHFITDKIGVTHTDSVDMPSRKSHLKRDGVRFVGIEVFVQIQAFKHIVAVGADGGRAELHR